jgi:hypothetical protein
MIIVILIRLFPYVIITQFLQQTVMLILLKVFMMKKMMHIIGNLVYIKPYNNNIFKYYIY